MARNGEWAECAQVASVLKGDEAEGNDDEQDGFLVNVPAEKEGCVRA